ncbi:hypothetical protein [Treponema sp. R80B11-R83G3]
MPKEFIQYSQGRAADGKNSGRIRLRSLPPPNKHILALYFEIFFLLGGGRLFSEFSLFYSQVSYGGEPTEDVFAIRSPALTVLKDLLGIHLIAVISILPVLAISN